MSQPEPVDWLGLSSLGSPDSTTRDAPLGKDTAAADKPSASAAGRDGGRQMEMSEGPPAGRTSAARGTPKADRVDVRRGSLFDDKGETSSLDWLKMAMDASAEKRPAGTGGRRLSYSTQDDDWLGTRRQSTAEEADSTSDYLGLGSEIDLGPKPARFSFGDFCLYFNHFCL